MAKIDEVFVFDDASSDNTHEIARSVAREGFGTKLSVFKNPST
jgi:glycosyltransferase involved in cell wall biosynthesis